MERRQLRQCLMEVREAATWISEIREHSGRGPETADPPLFLRNGKKPNTAPRFWCVGMAAGTD